MLADRYDLPVSTASAAARDAYVQGYDLALTLYPGAVEAFDRALAVDPGLALAHAGKAQVLMREGKAAAARAALAAAKDVAAGVSAREAGHIRFFDLAFSGQTDAAIDALYAHLAEWPRDALMIATAANPNGVIGGSGRVGQKQRDRGIAGQSRPALRRRLLVPVLSRDRAVRGWPHRGRPSEDRTIRHAQPEERACAHGMAHVCYESGDADTGRDFLSSWLATYPRDGAFHGHLSWHLALFELGAGNWTAAQQLLPRRHRARPAPGRTAAEDDGRRSVSVALRAGRPSARRPPRGARCTTMAPAHCRGRAPGLPICMSSSPRR